MIQEREIKEVTLDDLALMIGKGFKEVDQRFDSVESRLTNIEDRVYSIEDNMATKDDIHRLEKRFDGLEKTVFNDHGRRLRKIETKLQIA